MPNCVIKTCKNYRGKIKIDDNLSFHGLPNDPKMRKKWINLIRKNRHDKYWMPNGNRSIVCSQHFDYEDMNGVNSLRRRRLRKGAVPTKGLSSTTAQDDKSGDSDGDCSLVSGCDSVTIVKVETVPPNQAAALAIQNAHEWEPTFNLEETLGLPVKQETIPDTDIEADTTYLKHTAAPSNGKLESLLLEQNNLITSQIKDLSKEIRGLSSQKKDDCYDIFGKYIASLLRGMQHQRAMDLKAKMIALVASSEADGDVMPVNHTED